MMDAFAQHLLRIEQENLSEHWAPPTYRDGDFAMLYARENLRKRFTEPGWCRVWCHFVNELIVAHASIYDIGQGDIVGGHLSVEFPYRGKRVARSLQNRRLTYCDNHQLTLTGPIAPGNTKSAEGCKAMGFVPIRVDEHGATWVARPPKGSTLDVEGSLVPWP